MRRATDLLALVEGEDTAWEHHPEWTGHKQKLTRWLNQTMKRDRRRPASVASTTQEGE